MARIVAISTDLLLGSKVEAMLTAAGHEVTVVPTLANASLDETDLIVADLDVADLEAVVNVDLPALGYYSHVDVETKHAADAAGIDLAVPRSRMARELPALVDALLQA